MRKLVERKMKVVIVIVLLLSGNVVLNAQAPYKYSMGAVFGNMEGISYKMFVADKLAFQADLGVKFFATQFGKVVTPAPYVPGDPVIPVTPIAIKTFVDVELNPHIMYQRSAKATEAGQLSWFVGVGASIGYQFDKNGKFGANLIGGIEYSGAKTPLSVQLDYRPGYGMLFDNNTTRSFFDWTLALSVRYTF